MGLKEILEVAPKPATAKLLQLKKEHYVKRLGLLSYDELAILIRDTEQTMKYMPDHDPAWEYLSQSKRSWRTAYAGKPPYAGA